MKTIEELTAENELLRAQVDAIEHIPDTLAGRCFWGQSNDSELFETLHAILGGAPLEECTKPGFFWPCLHSYVDGYDSSVEVIMNPNGPRMTREQADQILALDFGQIYESHGDEAWQWGRNGCSKSYSRKGDEQSLLKAREIKLKEKDAEIRELRQLLTGAYNPKPTEL